MKYRNYFILKYFILFIAFNLIISCSSDDDGDNNTPEIEESNCVISGIEISGIIDENLLGNWVGEIYFNSVDDSYDVTFILDEDGSLIGSGPDLPTLTGCWRVSGDDMYHLGTVNFNGNSATSSFTGRIITQDSIYGTHTGTNGENGTLWMVR